MSSGDRPEGIRYLSRALVLTPAFDPAIFSYLSSQDVRVPELLKDGVLDQKRVAQAYLRYSIAERELASAQAAWKWIETQSFTDPRLANDYVNFLIAEAHFPEAAQVWTTQFRFSHPRVPRDRIPV